ncbi:uncharacterized protein LOC118648554 [Monomorium pharaonis]|uniref:uncharacterized protein LOC114255377 n=1 Tax=Monomorium pharaonis TaxID=307658 RepID=UPI00102E0FDA|nr:uncharacterized protein LOC114255377 [Monomorium pharaonis]XP_036150781.1 uncharacterized protein LOC118648554 [Monomorium pharaonis]
MANTYYTAWQQPKCLNNASAQKCLTTVLRDGEHRAIVFQLSGRRNFCDRGIMHNCLHDGKGGGKILQQNHCSNICMKTTKGVLHCTRSPIFAVCLLVLKKFMNNEIHEKYVLP